MPTRRIPLPSAGKAVALLLAMAAGLGGSARSVVAAEDATAALRVEGFAAAVAQGHWSVLPSGLEHLRVTIEDGNELVVWRFRQGSFKLEIKEQLSPHGTTAREIQAATDAPLVVDGGYYEIHDGDIRKPAGLLIVDGRQTGAFDPNPKAGTGLLYAKDGRISIGRSADHSEYGKLDQAVQVGPLLVDPGGINGIRSTGGEHASRATVCLTSDDQVAVIVTTDGIYRYDIGLLLSRPAADGGLGCERAINLDGEPSTQAVFINAAGKVSEVLTTGQKRPARMNNLLVFRPAE